MAGLVSKCGNFCGRCPWSKYTREGMTPEEWEAYRPGVKKYVGYNIQDLKPCHGCQTPTEDLTREVGVHNFIRGCVIRKCALNNGVETCAQCSRYPCQELKNSGSLFTRESVEERLGEPVHENAYQLYIEPFQGLEHLRKMRTKLKESEIVEMKPVPFPKKRIVDFPTILYDESLKSLHSLLDEVSEFPMKFEDADTFAFSEQLKKKRKGLYRMLWVLGLHGTITDDEVILNSANYFNDKKSEAPGTETGMREFLAYLKEYGIEGELEPLVEDQWKLPSDYLRGTIRGGKAPVWQLRFIVDSRIGGVSTMKALKTYVMELLSRYGNRGFTRFTRADMRMFE